MREERQRRKGGSGVMAACSFVGSTLKDLVDATLEGVEGQGPATRTELGSGL